MLDYTLLLKQNSKNVAHLKHNNLNSTCLDIPLAEVSQDFVKGRLSRGHQL